MFLFWESAGVPLHDSQFRTFASYKRPWFILQTVVAPTTLKPLSSDWFSITESWGFSVEMCVPILLNHRCHHSDKTRGKDFENMRLVEKRSANYRNFSLSISAYL